MWVRDASEPLVAPPSGLRSSCRASSASRTHMSGAYERASLHVLSGRRSFKRHRFVGAWMAKRKPPRMQRLSPKLEAWLNLAIERIVENRMPDPGHVHANLMRSAGFEAKEQLGMRRKGVTDLVVRQGGFAVGDDREPQTIAWIASDRSFDRPERMLRYATHESKIFALDAPCFHREAERAQALFALCDDEQARGVAIEAVDESGAQQIAGETCLHVCEQRIDQRPARRTVCRMRNHSGLLIDDQKIVVFVNDVERNRLGPRHEGGRLGNFEFEHVAGFQRAAGFGRAAVNENLSAPRRLR